MWPCYCQLIHIPLPQHHNNTTITNNNHDDNYDNIDYHNDDGHHNCHNNFITTKKKAARMKTSPNNAFGIIWAQVSFIYSPFVLFDANKCFIVSTVCIYDVCERERVGRPETTKTGPNNVSHVVWALGESFSIPLYYLILNNFLLPIQVVNYEIPDTQRDLKLETQCVSSFRSTTTTLHH